MTRSSLWKKIEDAEEDTILLASELADLVGGGTLLDAMVTEVILDAIKAGILEPVYKLNAPEEFLYIIGKDYWTSHLCTLSGIWFDSNYKGSYFEVDGRDPKNILVGFRKK